MHLNESALGEFGSAVSLAVVALLVFAESVGRLASPVSIRFDEAIWVAVVGLLVNLVSALLLREHDHDEEHASGHHHDHNLRGAYSGGARFRQRSRRTRTPVYRTSTFGALGGDTWPPSSRS